MKTLKVMSIIGIVLSVFLLLTAMSDSTTYEDSYYVALGACLFETVYLVALSIVVLVYVGKNKSEVKKSDE